MFLSYLIALIEEAGVPSEVIDETYKTIFDRYPSIQASIYRQPMSTAQNDPWVPEEFAHEILRELEVPLV